MQKAKTKNTLNLKLGMGERAAGREGSWTPTGCQSFNPVGVRREILSSPRSVVARKQGSQKSNKLPQITQLVSGRAEFGTQSELKA